MTIQSAVELSLPVDAIRWGRIENWQIVPRRLHELLVNANPDRARRTTEAMLRMSKLNIAELERAAEGR